MTEKMLGVLAELKTYTADGTRVDSQFVFKPHCDWYLDKLQDGLGNITFSDIGAVIDEFGADVAEKVVDGELVDVETEAPEEARMVSCRPNIEIVKIRSTIRYPYKGGSKEYLVIGERKL